MIDGVEAAQQPDEAVGAMVGDWIGWGAPQLIRVLGGLEAG
jgi:hypothetical protein